jgi:hypothetical protein
LCLRETDEVQSTFSENQSLVPVSKYLFMNKRPDYPDFNLGSVIEIDVSTALDKLRKLKVSFMRNESYINVKGDAMHILSLVEHMVT